MVTGSGIRHSVAMGLIKDVQFSRLEMADISYVDLRIPMETVMYVLG
jgi:hypothetical protein